MSVRRTAVPVLVSLATAGLIASSGAVASADPPALNRDPCATTLAGAAAWPGTLSDDVRLVSDAYVTYLGAQPECAADRPPARWRRPSQRAAPATATPARLASTVT